MSMENRQHARGRRLLAAVALILPLALSGVAEGHGVNKFWQYKPDVRKHTWRDGHKVYKKRHNRFHRRWRRSDDTLQPSRHRSWHHSHLKHHHRDRHFYRRLGREAGEASWYNADGKTGACGKVLRGMYAAHKTWPCGSLVSVKRGKKYVFVRVLDRGPYTRGRVIDLSATAFNKLGSTRSGTMNVRIFRIKKA